MFISIQKTILWGIARVYFFSIKSQLQNSQEGAEGVSETGSGNGKTRPFPEFCNGLLHTTVRQRLI